MPKKPRYEILTNETIQHKGITLFRIKYGPRYGGYIQAPHNLDIDSTAMIYNNAKVYGNAIVTGNAKVFNNAEICEAAIVSGNAEIYDNVEISGAASIGGSAQVRNYAKVKGHAVMRGESRVCDMAILMDSAILFDRAVISDVAIVRGTSCLEGNVQISGCAIVDSVVLGGRVSVSGNTQLVGGWRLYEEIDIRRGYWREPPLILRGSIGCIYEWKPNKFRLRGYSATLNQWNTRAATLLWDLGLMKFQVAEYRKLFEVLTVLVKKRNKRVPPQNMERKHNNLNSGYVREPDMWSAVPFPTTAPNSATEIWSELSVSRDLNGEGR